ncbi:hypothetical protein DBN05_001728 [Salmonella enterica subsp. enterica serovar Anderlecht]|nr:hypothetical protein [Salmonella enterica subsp. enterica serovar Anderlecht]EEJ3527705.1 hypothetical protein [Salmonella enterica subsp. enterica serovar Anderlecht]MIX08840.1 hypothetical protein [Salmonella enterica subsp. enterica serovar Anderlecht]
MKTGRRCFFLLILCAFSHGAQCSETLAQAITRIYGSPQDRMNYDIWLRGEMLENHRTASVASKPLFGTPANALCFCHNPNDISVEIRQANSFASDKFAEADITLKEKNHSRWLTLQLHKPHDRWLIADVDNIDDPLPSLGRQLHNDTQLKLLIAPQLAINNQKIADVTIAELLAHPDEYHSRKVRIRGLVLTGFERHAIYGDPQQDGLWLENFLVPYTVSRNHTEASMVVEGIFDMRVSGHLSHYPGGITNITRYEKVQPTRASAVTDISFTDLLQHPDHYHQKKIRLRGYVILGFEHAAIYANKDATQRENGFWLGNFVTNIPLDLQKDGGYEVLIEGTFNKDGHGHMGLSAGEITDISHYETITLPENVIQIKNQGAKE